MSEVKYHISKHKPQIFNDPKLLSAVSRMPTFLVVKSKSCHHCTKMKKNLKQVIASLDGSRINSLVIEMSALQNAMYSDDQDQDDEDQDQDDDDQDQDDDDQDQDQDDDDQDDDDQDQDEEEDEEDEEDEDTKNKKNMLIGLLRRSDIQGIPFISLVIPDNSSGNGIMMKPRLKKLFRVIKENGGVRLGGGGGSGSDNENVVVKRGRDQLVQYNSANRDVASLTNFILRTLLHQQQPNNNINKNNHYYNSDYNNSESVEKIKKTRDSLLLPPPPASASAALGWPDDEDEDTTMMKRIKMMMKKKGAKQFILYFNNKENDEDQDEDDDDEDEDTKLHAPDILAATRMLPTFIVVKSRFCGHCIRMKDSLRKMLRVLKDTGVNVLVLELSSIPKIRDDSTTNPVIKLLRDKRVLESGVPFIGVTAPLLTKEAADQDLFEYDSPQRDAVSLANFVLKSILEIPTKKEALLNRVQQHQLKRGFDEVPADVVVPLPPPLPKKPPPS